MASAFMSDVDVSMNVRRQHAKAGQDSDHVSLTEPSSPSAGSYAQPKPIQSQQLTPAPQFQDVLRTASFSAAGRSYSPTSAPSRGNVPANPYSPASVGLLPRRSHSPLPMTKGIMANTIQHGSEGVLLNRVGLTQSIPGLAQVTRPAMAEHARQPQLAAQQSVSAQEVHVILQGERTRVSEMIQQAVQEIVAEQTETLRRLILEETHKVAEMANTLSDHSSDRLAKLEASNKDWIKESRTRLEAEMQGEGILRSAEVVDLIEKAAKEQQASTVLRLDGMCNDLQKVATDISNLRATPQNAPRLEGVGEQASSVICRHVQKTVEKELLLLRQNTLTGLSERLAVLEGSRRADQETVRTACTQMRLELGSASEKMSSVARRTLEESKMYEKQVAAEQHLSQLIGVVTQQQGKVSELRSEVTRCLEKDMPELIEQIQVEQSVREALVRKVEDLRKNIRDELLPELEKERIVEAKKRWDDLQGVLHREVAELRQSMQIEHNKHIQTCGEFRSELRSIKEQLNPAEFRSELRSIKEQLMTRESARNAEGPPSHQTLPGRAELRADVDKVQAGLENVLGKLASVESNSTADLRLDTIIIELDRSLERIVRLEAGDSSGSLKRSGDEDSEHWVVAAAKMRRDLDRTLERVGSFEGDLDRALERVGSLEGEQNSGLRGDVDMALERLARLEAGHGADKAVQKRSEAEVLEMKGLKRDLDATVERHVRFEAELSSVKSFERPSEAEVLATMTGLRRDLDAALERLALLEQSSGLPGDFGMALERLYSVEREQSRGTDEMVQMLKKVQVVGIAAKDLRADLAGALNRLDHCEAEQSADLLGLELRGEVATLFKKVSVIPQLRQDLDGSLDRLSRIESTSLKATSSPTARATPHARLEPDATPASATSSLTASATPHVRLEPDAAIAAATPSATARATPHPRFEPDASPVSAATIQPVASSEDDLDMASMPSGASVSSVSSIHPAFRTGGKAALAAAEAAFDDHHRVRKVRTGRRKLTGSGPWAVDQQVLAKAAAAADSDEDEDEEPFAASEAHAAVVAETRAAAELEEVKAAAESKVAAARAAAGKAAAAAEITAAAVKAAAESKAAAAKAAAESRAAAEKAAAEFEAAAEKAAAESKAAAEAKLADSPSRKRYARHVRLAESDEDIEAPVTGAGLERVVASDVGLAEADVGLSQAVAKDVDVGETDMEMAQALAKTTMERYVSKALSSPSSPAAETVFADAQGEENREAS